MIVLTITPGPKIVEIITNQFNYELNFPSSADSMQSKSQGGTVFDNCLIVS